MDDALIEHRRGDEIEQTVGWTSGAEVPKRSGQPGRLRFVLRNADLYSFRFFE